MDEVWEQACERVARRLKENVAFDVGDTPPHSQREPDPQMVPENTQQRGPVAKEESKAQDPSPQHQLGPG